MFFHDLVRRTEVQVWNIPLSGSPCDVLITLEPPAEVPQQVARVKLRLGVGPNGNAVSSDRGFFGRALFTTERRHFTGCVLGSSQFFDVGMGAMLSGRSCTWQRYHLWWRRG